MSIERVTTDYKYHIYELVDGKWFDANPAIPDKAAQERFMRQLQNSCHDSTFKLVTEKITTVHEFEEEGVAAPSPSDTVILGEPFTRPPTELATRTYNAVRQAAKEVASLSKPRSCNRHNDCDQADIEAKARGRILGAEHCHDDCCEDCFGQ